MNGTDDTDEDEAPVGASESALDPLATAVVDLAVLTAVGHRASSLTSTVGRALDAGLAPGSALEAILQTVPFAGFARSLPAIAVIRQVCAERGVSLRPVEHRAGGDRLRDGTTLMREITGEGAGAVLERLSDTAPDVARLIVEFTYGDVYARPGLSIPLRVLVTISTLVALGDTAAPLAAQLETGLRAGWSRRQLLDLVERACPHLSEATAREAREVAATSLG
jgi:4-carboxymuconolactone decarboxylase